MTKQSRNPWRCWERLTMAGALNGPEDLLVRVALYDTRNHLYQSEFRWPALVRLGPNDYAGGYAQVTLRFGDLHWSFEMAGVEDSVYLLIRALPSSASAGGNNHFAAEHVRIHLETLYQRDAAGEIVTRENEVIARRRNSAWRVWSPSPVMLRRGSTLTAPLNRPFLAVIEPAAESGRRLESRVASERARADAGAALTAAEREIAAKIAQARQRYFQKFAFVPREFWWLYSAIPYGIGWNMVWARDRQEPIQVCSRDWCVHGNYGDWVLFNWDTFLLAPAAADYDHALAHQIVRPQLAVQTIDGLVPGIASPLGISADRGMTPDAALGLWKTYLRTGNRAFVEEYYEPLARYHEWWLRNRDGNRDGLLEWGSNPAEAPHPQWQAHTYWASRYETGMDNHPMWDDTRYNPETNTQEQSDVGLNALHATEALCLAGMAKVLGKQADAERLRAEADALGKRLDSQLWNEETGLWLSRRWDNSWNDRASPCCFYPCFLPTCEKQHVARAIKDHLRNPRRFGGRYAMPVSPRDDPAYPEQYYVRGRIWPAQMMIVHAALREARQEDAAAELAAAALETMRDEWLNEGHLHENYHAETADGDDTVESDPLYSFGLMLAQTAWNHLRDVRLDGSEAKAELRVFEKFLDRDGELLKQIDPLQALPPLA